MSVPGTIYLVCLDRPVTEGRPARHYLGWTRDLDSRIAEHQSGNGARLLSVALSRGIGFRVVRTWAGDRHLERRLKKIHGARLCPHCGPAIRARRTQQDRERRAVRKVASA